MTEVFSIIDNEKSLSQWCDQLRESTWLAVDTEFERVSTYYPELCLLQVSNGSITAVIDPIVINNLDALFELLYEPTITKVFHSAHQDLELFFNLKGSVPTPLFDTQHAAPLLGYAQGIGYGNLVKEVLNIELNKGHARTDWKKRPLSDAQLRYAADDVIYLGQVYEVFLEKLKQIDNLDELNEKHELQTRAETYQPAPETMWKKIYAARKLKGKQLAIVKQLAAWRERTARQTNRPRKWVMPDPALIDMAKRLPANKSELSIIDKLSDKMVNRYGEILLEIIADA